jgi:hypothetical protein
MNEKPLERLNYFNGQRLQAADLKLEQDYHIRVRRWLNRSLYSSGIAEGLSVYAIKDQARVRVTPGLAIDHLGREIILLEEHIVDVVGTHHDRGGRCDGPYLTIRYQEEIVGKQDLSCAVGGNASDRTTWGAPGRVLSGAILELNAELPSEESGRIPLACLTLTEKCKSVQAVDTGVRRYIGEGSANKVKQYALEGTRDLDTDNAATIVFHVRGRQPSSVTLYLKSEPFPTYFYTETGRHAHGLNVSLAAPDGVHKHELDAYTTGGAPTRNVTFNGNFVSLDGLFPGQGFLDIAARLAGVATSNPNNVQILRKDFAFAPIKKYTFLNIPDPLNPGEVIDKPVTAPSDVAESLSISITDAHTHSYGSVGGVKRYTIAADQGSAHTHAFAQRSIDASGISDVPNGKHWARLGAPLTFIEGLQIEIDEQPVTDAVLAQINSNNSAHQWAQIGDGTGETADLLAENGTDAIRVDFLVPLSEGAHTIRLFLKGEKSNGSRNGGRIHFNLYVE